MARSISVVVPFYQKKAAWKKTFEELKIQLVPDDEVIVVDDHSPSGIGVCHCEALTVVRPPKLGAHIYRLNTLRNLGIEKAKHDAVVVLDPDCIPNKNFLHNARRIFDPSVLFAGRIDFLGKNGAIQELDPRRGDDSSRWVDLSLQSGGMVWGGVMFFSKSRAGLVGMFDTDYDGGWGVEDHDFGQRCFSSGMRLRYEPGLQVNHQYHSRDHQDHERNVKLWEKKNVHYVNRLNKVTPYKPAVGVLIATLGRPYYIDQVMRGVFRTRVPLKVRLVNQGDRSPEQMAALKWWRGRWAVEILDLPEAISIEAVRAQAMEHFAKTYRYMLVIDDDILPKSGSIEALLRVLEEHPEYHAVAGGIIQRHMSRMLGGYIIPGEDHQYYSLPLIEGVAETSFISSGFTAFRLNPFIPFDSEFEFGWGDWDWANEIKKAGLRMAVCGDALAYHKYVITSKGPQFRRDPTDYMKIRYDSERHKRTSDRFYKRWGYRPRDTKLWEGAVLEGTLR